VGKDIQSLIWLGKNCERPSLGLEYYVISNCFIWIRYS